MDYSAGQAGSFARNRDSKEPPVCGQLNSEHANNEKASLMRETPRMSIVTSGMQDDQKDLANVVSVNEPGGACLFDGRATAHFFFSFCANCTWAASSNVMRSQSERVRRERRAAFSQRRFWSAVTIALSCTFLRSSSTSMRPCYRLYVSVGNNVHVMYNSNTSG